ncbi:MAG: mercuric reductase [Planctomycetes bacterium]|nr:mercuric reductase [Planctomycetota bacterium]
MSATSMAMKQPATHAAQASAEPLVLPLDAHNQRYLEYVHPARYTNPTPKDRYHLVVIGAGPGGLVAAAAAAGLGAKVALIERHLMGGDCLNVGCVPSKGVIRAARAWHEARHAAREFGGPEAAGTGNFAAAMERMRKLRANLSHVDSVQRYRDLGVDVFIGEGRFADPGTIEVAGARLRFRRAVIAAGARAAIPDVPGLAEAKPYTNETIFWLTELPRRVFVIGGGPIGCELAQSFARFGSKVTLFDRGAHVLPREDMDAARIVQEAMIEDGVELVLGGKLSSVATSAGTKTVRVEREGKIFDFAADEILVAAGRRPNVENLKLEAAGISYTPKGVEVDDRLRTTNKKVYAVGDICSRYQFTHAADFQARIVIGNSLFFGRGRASRLVMPWCTYTSPEIAHVGMYEKDAREAGHEVDTVTVPLEEIDRCVLDGEGEGFLRVHLKKGTDRILGATLVSEHAGDMIGEMAVAITAGVGLGKIGATIHPYPTQGEIFRKAADIWRRGKLTPKVRRILNTFLRIFK